MKILITALILTLPLAAAPVAGDLSAGADLESDKT